VFLLCRLTPTLRINLNEHPIEDTQKKTRIIFMARKQQFGDLGKRKHKIIEEKN
jgi:hypothetical protein